MRLGQWIVILAFLGSVCTGAVKVFESTASKKYVKEMHCQAQEWAKLIVKEHMAEQIKWQLEDITEKIVETNDKKTRKLLQARRHALNIQNNDEIQKIEEFGSDLPGPNCEKSVEAHMP